MNILTVTGYKPMEMNIFNETDQRIDFIKEAVKKRLVMFAEEGLQWVLISGQMGVELWTADVVMDMQEMYDLKLAVCPPFEAFDARWPEAQREKYQLLNEQADFFKPIYRGPYKAPYQFRARDVWFVDKSAAALVLVDEDFPGSTRYFLDVANHTDNYPIYTITPSDIDDVVEEMRMEDPDYWT